MYLLRVKIENIKSIKHLVWEIPEGEEAGWHVVIGDNGAGKSTLLKAIALDLIGENIAVLRPNWDDWLNKNAQEGKIILSVKRDPELDKFRSIGRKKDSFDCSPIILSRGEEKVQVKILLSGGGYETLGKRITGGWFSASYGPFRRFSGGDEEYEQLFSSYPEVAPHLSVFGERVAFTECLSWLKDLQFKKLEGRSNGNLLDKIKEFVNQDGFLPHRTQLEKISSDDVEFVDMNGCRLSVKELSEGYRSILSLTFELIRQLAWSYKPDQIFDKNDPSKIIAPGVVLIDEIDAHLHPTWQQQIGLWLKKLFPRMQFIVTTHSPLICQAADTVFLLPKPGTDEEGRMIEGIELNRLIYGNVLEAYGTQVFGKGVTRSEESKHLLRQLAELNLKEIHEGLTDEEMERQEELRAMFPTTPHTTG